MKIGVPIIKIAGFESVEDLPRTAVGYSSKAYQDLPPQLRLSATSNGVQRVRVHVPNAQGLNHSTQFLDLTCKRGSVGQNEGLLIPRSSVRFRLNLENSNSYRLELHRPSMMLVAFIITLGEIM